MLLKVASLELTIFGAESWGYTLTLRDKLVLKNEAKYRYTPIWIWWPEFSSFAGLPTASDFYDGGEAYTNSVSDGEFIPIAFSKFEVLPNMPGDREWKEGMKWKNLSPERQLELVKLLSDILVANEMLPMEVILCMLIIHPDTHSAVIKFIESLDEVLDLPKSIAKALMLRN
jgi:hypothetical protein